MNLPSEKEAVPVKHQTRIAALLTVLLLLCVPAACAAPEAAEAVRDIEGFSPWDGEYVFFCAILSPAYMDAIVDFDEEYRDIGDGYVTYEAMEGAAVTLNADGTGALDWGENNRGPIDWWHVDGDMLTFRAGAAEISGTVRDGFMTLDIEDGFRACFAVPGSEPDDLEVMDIMEYAKRIYGLE